MNINELDEIYEKNRLLKTVTIEIVNQCNWHCKHCYLDNKKVDMDINKIYEIIDDARKLGAYELRLSGGEVTTSPHLGNIIRYARKRYMNITLFLSVSITFLSDLIPVMSDQSPSLFSLIPSKPYFCLKKVLDF